MYDIYQINDCEETYSSLVTIPESTNVSTNTIRGFFNAYLLHKYFVDYIVILNVSKLVDKNWVYQTIANDFYGKLLQLQNALNFNIHKLNQLVSVLIQP